MADSDDSSRSHYYAEQNVQTAVGAAMIALSIFFVALRFYVRMQFNKAPLGWDDWLALAALVATVAAGLLVLMASIVDPNSYWLTENTDPDYHYTQANILHLKLVYISSIFYFSIVCPAKLSILCLYRRVFSVSQAFHVQVLLLMTVVALFYVATTLASIFSCWPLEYDWVNTFNQAPYCFNYNEFWLATGIIEAVLDVCLIALPVGMVTRLQMSAKKRMGMTGVFLLGAFGIGTGVVKAYEGYVPGSRSVNSNATVVWSAVHGGMGIICACLPVCWPLILRMTNLRLALTSRIFITTTITTTTATTTTKTKTKTGTERGGLRRTSDTELPMLAAPGPGPVVEGHELYNAPVYPPQVRIWSDASRTGAGGTSTGKTVHVIRRCDYPI